MLEIIKQWAANICFAAAASGLCCLIAPESGLGRMLKMSISVFFLCSIVLPLKGIDIDINSREFANARTHAEQIAEETKLNSQKAAFDTVEITLQTQIEDFLIKAGITPVRVSIDIIQQDSYFDITLSLLLDPIYKEKENWLRQNLQSEYMSLSIDYTEGESDG